MRVLINISFGVLMDEKTLLALIRRMDDMERRIMARIDVLWDFRLKVLGGALVLSAIVSFVFESLKH